MLNGNRVFPGHAEDMEQFFDARAVGYERHMRNHLEDHAAFYRAIADAVADLGEAPDVLDLGIGTGLELDGLFERCPRAKVTGIDLSTGMLDELARKTHAWRSQVTLVAGSFLDLDLGRERFDAVISSMALHHWTAPVKLSLYRRIRTALRADGLFVNGDYVESTPESQRRLADFAARRIPDDHRLHIDLPLSVERERELLLRAGFRDIRTVLRQASACVFAARAPGAALDASAALAQSP